MSDGTKIEWADATVNAINGCSLASPGCTNCYAMKQAHRFPIRRGLTTKTKGGMVWTGEVRLSETMLMQPLAWKRPRVIFWNAHGDPFHPAVPDEWVDRMFAVMALTPQHKHLVLTKRSARMREYLNDRRSATRLLGQALLIEGGTKPTVATPWPLPNVWLGVSVEDQVRADERIPDLLATPAAGRFLSCEPLLGPIDLRDVAIGKRANSVRVDALTGCEWDELGGRADGDAVDGIIVGGESGPGARPMHPNWARSLRDQCAAAGVDFHFKQWGSWLEVPIDPKHWNGQPSLNLKRGQATVYPDGSSMGRGYFPIGARNAAQMDRVSKKDAGRLLDGVQYDALPWRKGAA